MLVMLDRCTVISQLNIMILKFSQSITEYIIKKKELLIWSFMCASSKALELYAKSINEGVCCLFK